MKFQNFNSIFKKYDKKNDKCLIDFWEVLDKKYSKLPIHLLIDTFSCYKKFGDKKFIKEKQMMLNLVH